MNSILLNALMSVLAHVVSQIFASGVFAEIQKLVEAEVNTTKTPAEKQKAVKDGLSAIKGDLGEVIRSTATWAINLGIETAVAQVKVKLGTPVSTTV